MRFGRLLVALAFVGFTWSCDSGASGTSCAVDTDCDQGSVCVGGSCAQVECTTHSECPGEDPFCAPAGVVPSQPDKRFCSPLACKTPADCGDGQTCNEYKQCEAGTSSQDTTPDDTTTTPDVVEDTTVTPGQEITSCIACTKDADCTNSTCQVLSGSTFCFADCATNDDCPTGWMCYALSATGKKCIPMKFNCEATCLTTPCAAGLICNQDTGECQEPKTECGGCQQDWECQPGYRCNQVGKYCAPECGVSDACPTNSACQEINTNSLPVNVCVSSCAQCCYGDACQCSTCPADKPYSKNGTCVQCLNDTHCTTGTCSTEGTCQGGTECPADKPYDKNGVCVECLQDSHCTTANPAYTCVGNVCKDATDIPEECTYCQDPYPACVQINGIWSCVQCTDDSYCLSPATCDTGLYSCNNGVVEGNDCGMCTQDSDCVSSQGLTLTCDTVSHCCYDAEGGSCDSVEVYCKDGLPCKSLLDLMGGIGGGSIPGMPEMGGMAGSCGCANPTSDIMSLLTCSFMGGCPESGCVSGSVCVDPNAVMSLLGGGTSTTPSEYGMCFNLQDLLGGLGL